MGFRFRKSVKAGPVRLNFSKSGVGYSVGGKGFRFTQKANGGTRTTTSIPGTGISFVKDSKKERGRDTVKNTRSIDTVTPQNPDGSNNQANGLQPVTKTELLLAWLLGYFGAHKFYRKKFVMGILYVLTCGLFFIGWLGDSIWLTAQYISAKKGKPVTKGHKIGSYIAGFLCFFMLGSCGGAPDNAPQSTEPIATEVAAIETTVEETTITETAAPTTVPQTIETTSETVETAAPEATEPSVTIPATEYSTEPVTEPNVIVPPATVAAEPEEEMVWIPTNGGKKYHSNPYCSGMDNPAYVTVSQAIARKFTPCKRCY